MEPRTKEFKMNITARALTAAIGLSLASLAGCDGRSGNPSGMAASTVAAIPAAKFITGEKPANAPHLTNVKANADVGDKVMFEARVGGRVDVFVDGMAIFVAADPKLISCDQRPGDYCKVPWDYCCENFDAMKNGMATIQIIDDAGLPYEVSAEGQGGLEPLKTVVIQGVVSEKGDDGNFVVDASGIWVGTIPANPPGEEDASHDHDHG